MRRVRYSSDNVHVRATWMRRPYIYRDCRKDFSVNTGAVLWVSMMVLSSQAIAFYLDSTNLKSVSGMKSLRVLGMTQNLPSDRVLCSTTDSPVAYGGWSAPAQHLTPIPHPRGLVGTDIRKFKGVAEVGVTCVGGMEGSKREWKKHNAGRGQVGDGGHRATCVAVQAC